MHKVFYLNNNLTKMEDINLMFGEGLKIKTYLNKNNVRCGYSLECKALLEAVIFKVTKQFIWEFEGEKNIR